MSKPSVSIVLCTYNGARFLREQLDTIVGQTYPLSEIIIQDDGSTDATLGIINEYKRKYPTIKVFSNEAEHGVNGNFFSAMRRASSDFIAISDQDDIWELTKVEKMVAAIGDALLCSCRTKPFSDDGSPTGYDERVPNYKFPRLLFASVLGHSMLFRRELLRLIPDVSLTYYDTVYDVILGSTAAACGSIVICNEILVHQRRYAAATTISEYDFDKRRTPSVSNGLYILFWSLRNFRSLQPYIFKRFQTQLKMLKNIKSPVQAEFFDSLYICNLEGRPGLDNLFKMAKLFVKHRHHLFYAEDNGLVNFARAILYPIMQVYDYRNLLPGSGRP